MYFRFYEQYHLFIPWSQWVRSKHESYFWKSSPDGATGFTSDNYSVQLSSSKCGRTGDKICCLRLTCRCCSRPCSRTSRKHLHGQNSKQQTPVSTSKWKLRAGKKFCRSHFEMPSITRSEKYRGSSKVSKGYHGTATNLIET